MPRGGPQAARTHCPAGHPYDAANTAYTNRGRSRYCRACARERSKARNQLPERRAYIRAYGAANRQKANASNRKWRETSDPFAYWLWNRHGLRPEGWTELWNAQDGKCYLCGDEMTQLLGVRTGPRGPTAVIDHDHACCPQGKSCSICRRGLAHAACNMAIGLLFDDPVRLRRAAEAFEVAQSAVQNRKQRTAELLF